VAPGTTATVFTETPSSDLWNVKTLTSAASTGMPFVVDH
jgi:hypothetical protein